MNFNNSTSRNFSLGIRGGGVGSSNNSAASSLGGQQQQQHNSIKYVYELPYLERKEICRIFDENNLWETLGGGLMGYSSSELSEFGRAFLRGSSPTDALLTAWASQNHTVLELFTLFGRLTHFRAMKVIARFVDPKYHVYIRDPEVNATQELIQLDSPVSPVAAVPPVELKVQNNIGYHHHHLPESPKNKLADPALKKEISPEAGVKGPTSSTASSSLLESVGHLPQIPYQELLAATNNWERRNILGKGGFGTVYKGVWKNTAVAIKRMEQRANHAYVESQMKQSLGELKCLNSCRHDNILPLYGFSLEGEHPCLVYQFMVNGSLEDRLLCRHKTPPLQWLVRYQIVRGVACGIQFLHSIGPKPLIHGDIKSANILLDRNFEAKIGDFGLAREMSNSSDKSYVKVSRVHGTRPYLPDEYLRSKKLSTKVDTYSFGIMLYEVATGQRAYEENRTKKFLRDVIEDVEGNYEPLRDPKAGGDNPDVYWHFIKVGRSCTEKLAKNRPEMVQVLKAFDMFFSQQSIQASSIRTVSSQVTGIPLLFETPNSRPGSLLLPGNSTTNRLSPEMRPTTSPYWIPSSQGQVGYQSPPTMSTNQSTASSNIRQIQATGPQPQQQQQFQVLQQDMVRRSPLPSPSNNYAIPQMANSGAPGMYNHQQQMINPFQQQQQQHPPPPIINQTPPESSHHLPPLNLNIGGGGGGLYQSLNPQLPSPSTSFPPQVPPRARNPSQQNNGIEPNSNTPPQSVEPSKGNQQAPSRASSAGNGNSQQPSNSGSGTAMATPQGKQDGDDFLPVFLLDKEDGNKREDEGQRKAVGEEGTDDDDDDDEDNPEWTQDEQDGPATVIPLITELGIKDQQDS